MFNKLKSTVVNKFEKMSEGALFQVEVDRDAIWDTYLNAFPEEFKQENNCNCCKSFLRQFGGIVSIKNNKIVTLWDEKAEGEYEKPVEALRKYISSLPIVGIFLTEFKVGGTSKSFDGKRGVEWNHFSLNFNKKFVKSNCGELVGLSRDAKNLLQRSISEISDDAAETVLELINQNSIYKGAEYKASVESLIRCKKDYKNLNKKDRENFLWARSQEIGPAFCGIKNSSIGKLLMDISGGDDLDKAVNSYLAITAPSTYKRPTALVTPRMIEDAKKRLAELGLITALSRRQLAYTDLSVNNSIFVHRDNKFDLDVFEQLKSESTVNPKSFSKVEEISIDDFVEKVVPTAKSINALVENSHFNRFVSLVGPKDDDAGNLFKWNNNFSWSYSGEVADSIKEKVKNAGGSVDGILRVSLSWHNHDDLDLHIIEPGGYKIFYPNKRKISPSGGMLDVDMNAGYGSTREPVENIFWTRNPTKNGKYKVIVNNFSKREETNSGFEIEIEYNGEVYTFSSNTNGLSTKSFEVVEFEYSDKNGFSISSGNSSSKYNSKEKWGVKSGQWTKVKAITLSPNHWEQSVGNKHVFFFLENCVSDEKIRPFYNENLREELSKDRKVFEVLGGRIEVEKVPGELSGIGFSDTRDHLFVEVEGKFKRIIKIRF